MYPSDAPEALEQGAAAARLAQQNTQAISHQQTDENLAADVQDDAADTDDDSDPKNSA